MIKFLFKSLIIVLLLLLLIPLTRFLIWIISHVFADIGLVVGEAIDPLGVAALLLIGIAIVLFIVAIKS